MKVELKADVVGQPRFKDVPQGGTFIDPEDDELHIKIRPVGPEDGVRFNAVRLCDGQTFAIMDDNIVFPVSTKAVSDQCKGGQ